MAVGREEKFPFHTRIIHNTLAIAVLIQLLSETLMHAPRPNRAPNFWFYIHEISGTIALVFVLAFWFLVLTNRIEKPIMSFFPYFSKDGRASLWRDTKRFFQTILKFKLPAYDGDSEFVTAIEGLGLLLITYMGATGFIYGLMLNIFHLDFRALHDIAELHETFGIFVWLYILGHGGMGILHQFTDGVSLKRMWSFKK